MKKLIMGIVLLVFFAGTTFAQATANPAQPQPKPAADDKNAPEIIFETAEHDFGKIPFGGNGSCEFKFKNMGKNPLVLEKVQASCGCTTPSWSKEPIKKKDSSSIKVQYDTKRVGPFTKSITVSWNAKNTPTVLIVKGEVLPDAQKATNPTGNSTLMEQPKRIPENK
jgi:hypothetical protein